MKQIMIVDDDPVVRSVVIKALERRGLVATAVGSGQECLQKLRDGFRGLILMDITMPDMDGWDTVRCIVEEELYEGCIISMLTGLHVPGPKLDGLKEYVIDYITKPFDPTELADTVVKYLSYL